MRLARTLVAAAATVALVAAPVASATAATHHPEPRFVVSALQIIGKSSYDVTNAAATVKIRVQVKDFDKKFDPTKVKVVVVKKTDSTDSTFTVTAHLVGRSKVVSNWLGTISVPKGAPAAQYCLMVVKVSDASPYSADVTARASHLPGRDCFTVTG